MDQMQCWVSWYVSSARESCELVEFFGTQLHEAGQGGPGIRFGEFQKQRSQQVPVCIQKVLWAAVGDGRPPGLRLPHTEKVVTQQKDQIHALAQVVMAELQFYRARWASSCEDTGTYL